MHVTVLPLFGEVYLQDLYAGRKNALGRSVVHIFDP
jgi:hypothetical protein